MAAEATGRPGRREGRDAVVFERRFRAPIEDVWAAITEPERLARWIGTWTGDPASGSVSFTMNAEGEGAAPSTYEIDACEPPRRLVVRSVNDYGVWVLHLDLEHEAGVTTLAFAHVVDDPDMIESTGPGWDWYLDRLVAAETGADPTALDWDRDYYPALREHYVTLRTLLPGA